MPSVSKFEELLRYYLDIGKDEQTRRLADRESDQLKR